MSSSVCQGLQTCLEPAPLVEPLVLRLKLAPSRSTSSFPSPPQPPSPDPDLQPKPAATAATTTAAGNNDMGGWSFLQSLDGNNSCTNKDEKDRVYVHPLAKRSASKLSPRSLAMCTENLGSETGSESGDDISLLSLESGNGRRPNQLRSSRSHLMTRKKSRDVTFPPPLTSISGSSGVQVRPHREGGRLILKAVKVTSSNTNFQAERSNGRLRLRFLTDETSTDHVDEEEQETGEAEQETEDDDHETESDQEDVEEDENEDDDDEEDDEEEEEEEEVYWGGGGDMGRNYGNVGGEIGIENFGRPRSRCKESGHGNNGLLNKNWEPFWVAT